MIEVTWSFHRWFIEHQIHHAEELFGSLETQWRKVFLSLSGKKKTFSICISCNFRWVKCIFIWPYPWNLFQFVADSVNPKSVRVAPAACGTALLPVDHYNLSAEACPPTVLANSQLAASSFIISTYGVPGALLSLILIKKNPLCN